MPRLAVGVYATSAATALLRLAIGRFCGPGDRGDGQRVPAVGPRPAGVGQPARGAARPRAGQAPSGRGLRRRGAARRERHRRRGGEDEPAFQSLHADAELDPGHLRRFVVRHRDLRRQRRESDYLGLPGLLDADQVRELLSRRQTEQLTKRAAVVPRILGRARRPTVPPRRPCCRCARNSIRWSPCTTTALAKPTAPSIASCANGWGPPTAMASAEQLTERIAALREWR